MFTSAEVHHSPGQISIHANQRLPELRTLLASEPGNWSRVENGPSKSGIMVILRNGPEIIANLYVAKDWIAFKEAGERGPPIGAPTFEKKLPPGVTDKIMKLFKAEIHNQRLSGPGEEVLRVQSGTSAYVELAEAKGWLKIDLVKSDWEVGAVSVFFSKDGNFVPDQKPYYVHRGTFDPCILDFPEFEIILLMQGGSETTSYLDCLKGRGTRIYGNPPQLQKPKS
jgi:hypothetical protein